MRLYFVGFVFLVGLLNASTSNECLPVQELAGKCKPSLGVTIKTKLDKVDLRINVARNKGAENQLSYVISDPGDKWAEYHEFPIDTKLDIKDKIHGLELKDALKKQIQKAKDLAALAK